MRKSRYTPKQKYDPEEKWPEENESDPDENEAFYHFIEGEDKKAYNDFKEAYHDTYRLRLIEDRYKRHLHPDSLYQRTRKSIINRLELTKSEGKTSFGQFLKKYDLSPMDFDFLCSLLAGEKYSPEGGLVIYDSVTEPLVSLHLPVFSKLMSSKLVYNRKYEGYLLPEKTKCELLGIEYTENLKRKDYRAIRDIGPEYNDEIEETWTEVTDKDKETFEKAINPIEESKRGITSTKDFDDLILNEITKAKLQSAITLFQKREQLNQRFGLDKIHSTESIILNFHGPPGTGKTLAAEVIARAMNKNMIITNFNELMSKWVGETEQNIHEIFKQAEDSKVVLFFDEVDAIAQARTGNENAIYYNLHVNTLLKELEKFKGICIMATNLPNLLDSAIERRVLMHIGFEQPNVAEREQIFKLLLKHSAYDKKIDFKQIARKYDFSGGLIKNAIINAIAQAASEDALKLSEKHLLKGCELVKEGSTALYGKEEKITYWG